MRIIFVIKKLENIAGGAEKVLSIISSELANRGHEINVISFDFIHKELIDNIIKLNKL